MIKKENLGNPLNKMWIVGACPKLSDKESPYTSTLGNKLLRDLNRYGLSRTQIHFDYLINKTPPKGKSSGSINYFNEIGLLEPALEDLKTKIKMYKPNLVLGLGADVLYYLLGHKGILKWRGHPIWSEELQCKIMVSFDPYHAHQQSNVHKSQKPGQYNALLQADIKRACAEASNSDMLLDDPELIVAPTFSEAKKYLIDMYENAKIISYDIEIFQPYEGRLMDCIGLCSNTNSAICIPFYVQNIENKIIRYWKSDLEHNEIFYWVRKIMESRIPKVAQNSQFDTTMLEYYYNTKTTNLIWDTMVVQHELWCDLPKDLGTLISLYTKLPYHKYMIHSPSSCDRWKYNAADAIANLHVMQGQIKEMYELEYKKCPELSNTGYIPKEFFELNAAKHYYQVPNPTINSCIYMHMAGIKVDMKFRDKVIKTETEIIHILKQALKLALPHWNWGTKGDEKTFNPLSPKQKNLLFYGILKCKVQRNKGKMSSDKNALTNLINTDQRSYVKLLAKICLEIKAADARLLKFKVEPDEGYIRTKYDVTGTDTGRLASKESDVLKAGTNLQNIAKGPQRQMLVPEEGEEFALVDLYAAEAFLTALDAGEIEMLKMISGLDETEIKNEFNCRIMSEEIATKYKIHNWMQKYTQDNWPKECEKSNYIYKKAKQTIHALNYNVQPNKMTLESGLPIGVSQWQYTMYHHKFPGIKSRMNRINIQLNRYHSLISPMGRRRIFLMRICEELYNIAYAWPSQSTIGEVTEVACNYLHLMSDLYESGKKVPFCRPVLNTHDGMAIRIKKNSRQKVIPYILNSFNIPLILNNCTITIPVSIGFADNFNDITEENVYFYPLTI